MPDNPSADPAGLSQSTRSVAPILATPTDNPEVLARGGTQSVSTFVTAAARAASSQLAEAMEKALDASLPMPKDVAHLSSTPGMSPAGTVISPTAAIVAYLDKTQDEFGTPKSTAEAPHNATPGAEPKAVPIRVTVLSGRTVQDSTQTAHPPKSVPVPQMQAAPANTATNAYQTTELALQSMTQDQLQNLADLLSAFRVTHQENAPPPSTPEPEHSVNQQPTSARQTVAEGAPSSTTSADQVSDPDQSVNSLLSHRVLGSMQNFGEQLLTHQAANLMADAKERLLQYMTQGDFQEQLKGMVERALNDCLADHKVVSSLLRSLLGNETTDGQLALRFHTHLERYTQDVIRPMMDERVIGLKEPVYHRHESHANPSLQKPAMMSKFIPPTVTIPPAMSQLSPAEVPTAASAVLTASEGKAQKSKKDRGNYDSDPSDSSSSDSSSSSSSSDSDHAPSSSSSAGDSASSSSSSSSSDSDTDASGSNTEPEDKKKKAKKSSKKSKKKKSKTRRKRDKKKEAKLRRMRKKFSKRAVAMEKEDGLTPLKPVNSLFADAVDFRTYRLENRDPDYDDKAGSRLRKKRKDVTIDMQGVTFDGKDPVAIINFLRTFKEACDSNEVSEGIAKRMFQYFLKGTPHKALRKAFKSRGKHKAERKKDRLVHKVTTYPAIVQMLLKTYANDEILSEAHASVSDFKKPDTMHPVTFANMLSDKAERTGDVFSEETLREVFIMALQASIRGYVHNHLSQYPKLSLSELARYAANVDNMQSNKSTPSTPSTDNNTGRSGKKTNDKTPKDNESVPSRSDHSSPQTCMAKTSADYADEILAADMAAAPRGQLGQYHTCRVYLGHDHLTQMYKFLNAALTPKFFQVRENNYLRIRNRRNSAASSRTLSHMSTPQPSSSVHPDKSETPTPGTSDNQKEK